MNESIKAPAHLWLVGVLSMLWNGYGAFDYVMNQTRNPAYLAGLTEEQRAYLDAAPVWVDAAWALGVWGAVAGSLLLLARSRYAVPAFAVSLAGLVANTLYQFTVPRPDGHFSAGVEIAMHAVIWTGAIGLLIYAWRMRADGVLR